MNRKEAVKGAIASVEMEGFVFTKEQKDILAKLAKGEINHNDVLNYVKIGVKKLRKEHPEIFIEVNSRVCRTLATKPFKKLKNGNHEMLIAGRPRLCKVHTATGMQKEAEKEIS